MKQVIQPLLRVHSCSFVDTLLPHFSALSACSVVINFFTIARAARQRGRETRVKKKTSRPQKNVDLYFCNS
jgi:hypothetical protein